MVYDFMEILERAIELLASDIHFTVGKPPILRVKGDLLPYGEEELTPEDTEEICLRLMNEDKRKAFEERGEVDFSWSDTQYQSLQGKCVTGKDGSYTAAMRMINVKIPTVEELRLRAVLNAMALKPVACFLVYRATGFRQIHHAGSYGRPYQQ